MVLKRILPEHAGKTSFVHMFLDEARLASRLNHEHVARVLEVGTFADSYCFVMEYVDGKNLREVMHRASQKGLRIPVEIAVAVIHGAASGLHAAHELRDGHGRSLDIVHRDVSPSNVMIGHAGAVKLVDFGVAMAADRMTETRTGVIKGKIAYLSPEQCDEHPLDRRSDVFSLGIVAWELLAKRRLFHRDSDYRTMQAIVSDPIEPPSAYAPHVPPAIDAVVMKALARAPEARYATTRELADALVAAYGRPISADVRWKLADFMRALFTDTGSVTEVDLATHDLSMVSASDQGVPPARRTLPRLAIVPLAAPVGSLAAVARAPVAPAVVAPAVVAPAVVAPAVVAPVVVPPVVATAVPPVAATVAPPVAVVPPVIAPPRGKPWPTDDDLPTAPVPRLPAEGGEHVPAWARPTPPFSMEELWAGESSASVRPYTPPPAPARPPRPARWPMIALACTSLGLVTFYLAWSRPRPHHNLPRLVVGTGDRSQGPTAPGTVAPAPSTAAVIDAGPAIDVISGAGAIDVAAVGAAREPTRPVDEADIDLDPAEPAVPIAPRAGDKTNPTAPLAPAGEATSMAAPTPGGEASPTAAPTPGGEAIPTAKRPPSTAGTTEDTPVETATPALHVLSTLVKDALLREYWGEALKLCREAGGLVVADRYLVGRCALAACMLDEWPAARRYASLGSSATRALVHKSCASRGHPIPESASP